MSTQPISVSTACTNGTYDALAGKITELTRLEQNIKKMKSEYEQYSKVNDSSSPGVVAKIKELDDLISKVQQQIVQIKRDGKKNEADSSKTTASCNSSYKYLGSVAAIYKKAFSLAHSACSEASAAMSGNLHAPSAILTASPSEVKKSGSLSLVDVKDALSKINAVQSDFPSAAINAAFSDGVDVLK